MTTEKEPKVIAQEPRNIGNQPILLAWEPGKNLHLPVFDLPEAWDYWISRNFNSWKNGSIECPSSWTPGNLGI